MSLLRNYFFIVAAVLILGGLAFPISGTAIAEENNSAPCIKSCDDNMQVCRNRYADWRRCEAQFDKCMASCNQKQKGSDSGETKRIPANKKVELR